MTITEEKTPQNLEECLETPSAEEEAVSEGQKPETQELLESQKPKAEEKKPEKVEVKPDAIFEARVQSAADKRVQSYRGTRESDIAYIQKLQAENVELRQKGTSDSVGSLIKSILSEDEANGLSPEQTKTRAEALKEFALKYDSNCNEVKKAAQALTAVITKIPEKIVKGFGLDDPNPNVKAVNIANLVSETATIYSYSQNFLMVVEEFLPRGDEVRKQFEEIIEGMADFEGNDKAIKLYLADKLKGLRATPRKKPQVPSDGTGGQDLSNLSDEVRFNRALEKMMKNKVR